MPGIFVSYRRVDAGGWAGRLYDNLVRRLGRSLVFMDVEGGVPRGADFPTVLETALAGCGALIAVIGPQWTTCSRTDGRRRLDVEDDWVRREIRVALGRGIPICQALVGGAARPEKDALPEDLQQLVQKQAAELAPTRWDYEVREMLKDLASQTKLVLDPLDEVAEAAGGLKLLQDLIVHVPSVADAVVGSREVLTNTSRQIGRLETHKLVHDALHAVEWECLRPLEAASAITPLRGYRNRFADAGRRIRTALQRGEIRADLASDLGEKLDAVERDFAAALAAPSASTGAAREALLEDLRAMLRSLPGRLDEAIATAAGALDLDRLLGLMEAVCRTVRSGPAARPELAPLLNGMESMRVLRDELVARVREHGALQDLDWKLRTLCEERPRPSTLGRRWEELKRARDRLPSPPRTPELAGSLADLDASMSEVAAALARGEADDAGALFEPCSSVVSSTFRSVDGGLRDFCLRLTAVNQPLGLVLEMCRAA